MPAPSPDELRAHLTATRIAGDVATPRDNNLRNMGLCAERQPAYTFGLDFEGTWTFPEVLALMAERCGVVADASYDEGVDTIDPDLTLAALDRMRDRLAAAADARERVLVATGHPTGLLAVHGPVALALAARGCELLQPAPGAEYATATRGFRIRHVAGVAMIGDSGALHHTHSPKPMRTMLGALEAAGEPPPDLVIADHGWAGAAGQAGIDAVGYADCNDPALFVGEAEGRVRVVVPLDDNVLPHLYAPLTAYLLAGWAPPPVG